MHYATILFILQLMNYIYYKIVESLKKNMHIQKNCTFFFLDIIIIILSATITCNILEYIYKSLFLQIPVYLYK